MSLSSTNRRKSSTAAYPSKDKFTTKHTEMKNGTQNKADLHEAMKRSDVPASMNTHRKSDGEKSLYSDAQEKASGEPYVRELKEFAGVTIIIRGISNPKAFGSSDGHGKLSTQGARRRSEFQQSQQSIQDKSEYGDKSDHSGAGHSTLAEKAEVSTNNSNETSSGENQE